MSSVEFAMGTGAAYTLGLGGLIAQYDSIIIGSGISGLTAATLCARALGEKVLVLEQHHTLGGFTHTFKRGKYEWDTGLHYVGKMDAAEFPRILMDYVTAGKVNWLKMPEPFECFHFPEVKFAQTSGEENLTRDLCKLFPAERAAIEAYFHDIGRAQVWGNLRFAAQVLPWFLAWIPRLLAWPRRRFGRMTLGEYFASHGIYSKNLVAALAGQCGDYGLPPSAASFFVHALIVKHYATGGYYPEGGSKRLGEAARANLSSLGGEILLRHSVEEILVEKGQAVGVRARIRGEEKIFRAKRVISTVGSRQTFQRLLSGSSRVAEELQKIPTGMTMATIYIGLKESAAKLGFQGENHWIFKSNDFEDMLAKHNKLPDGEVQGAYLSFPSLKARSEGPHTAEILIPIGYDYFSKLAQGGWRRRGQEYDEAKAKLAEQTLEFVEEKFPGFRALIDYMEVSTPLSIEHFSRQEGGEAYGLPAVPARYTHGWLGPRTHIKGLYLAGADVLAHGIVGAMMSGLCAVTARDSLPEVIKVFRSIFARKAEFAKSSRMIEEAAASPL